MIRLLDYYANQQYPYWILIADSSDEKHFAPTAKRVKDLQGVLQVKHFSCPNMTVPATLQFLANLVETPYTVYTADDDFLVPKGLQACADFLNLHADYSAAQGFSVLFHLDRSGPYGQMAGMSKYRVGQLEDELAQDRFQKYTHHYFVNIFSLQRTTNWKTIASWIPQIPEHIFAGELFPCFMSVVQGKVKLLNDFYLVRQGHDRRYPLLRAFDWITHPSWQASFTSNVKALAETIAKQDNIEFTKAENIVKSGLYEYFQQRLQKKKVSYIQRLKNVAKEELLHWPKTFRIIKKIKALIKPTIELDIQDFLKKESIYYAEFSPIHELITKDSKDHAHAATKC